MENIKRRRKRRDWHATQSINLLLLSSKNVEIERMEINFLSFFHKENSFINIVHVPENHDFSNTLW